MTFYEAYDAINEIPYEPWMPEKDCRCLYNYVSKLKDATILEIGGWAGRSGKFMATVEPSNKIYTIDWLQCTVTEHEMNVVKEHEDQPPKRARDILLNNVQTTDNWTLIGDSSQKAWKFWDKPIDFLVIDGSHAYEFVKNDIKNYMPFLKENHYFLIHDAYDYGAFPGIMKSVQEQLINENFILFEHGETNYLEGQKL